MAFLSLLRYITIIGLLHTTFAVSIRQTTSHPINATCNAIASAISPASNVYFPGSEQYADDIEHFASSSTQTSVCSVEPGTPQDVGVVLQILGTTNTLFAVKGGGHTFNPGFSSTTGIQVSLTRFQQINIDSEAETVELGTGLVWDTVYTALDAVNLTVIGGRVTGVGVAGFILGGGLSFKTPEYGIATSNIVALELVLPNGTVTSVTAESNPDLFFAVRGTQNNYGIVTSITMKAIQQGLVWGGTNVYAVNSSTIDEIIDAVYYIANNVTDPKAASVLAFDYQNNQLTLDAILFYNDLTPPPGVFDKLLAIPPLVNDATTRTYEQVVASSNGNDTLGFRASLDHVMIQEWTVPIIKAVINETQFWGEKALQIDPNAQILNPLEPFLPNMFQHGDPGAWPPQGINSPALMPQGMQWSWSTGPDTDSFFINGQKESAQNILSIAGSEGQNTTLPLYPNYSISGTPLHKIYGFENLERLKFIKQIYDPNNVMGLAGGWKIPT